MLNNAGEAESHPMFGKINPLYPDTKPDRLFSRLLRPDFIRRCINAPECCCKYQVVRFNKVPEVPEIINILRK